MRWMSLLLLVVGALGCGEDHKTRRGSDGGDDAGMDASADADAGRECEGTATAVIGTAGGELSFCGARLIVPADVLSEDTEFGMAVAEVPDPAAPDVLAGRAFRFWPNDAPLPGKVEIELPHDGGGDARIALMRLVDGDLQGFEACRVEDDVIAQNVDLLGVFVAVRDPNTYPEGPSGLGEGTVMYSVDEADYTGDVAGGGGLAGYVIDESPVDTSHSITAVLRAPSGIDSFSQVDLRFYINDTGGIEVAQIAWTDLATSESANWVSAVHPLNEVDANLTFLDGTLSGDLSAVLHAGDETRAFTSSLEVTAVRFRYPPELSCGFPEG